MTTMSSYAVTAEMVASVGQVVAHVGDRLEPTDTVVVLESMKMEIPVLATVHGVVRELSVVQGDVITEGDIIAVLDTAAN
jgi:acetyl-CoA carboxylase biotin carboxyl carrier protein